MSEKNYYGFSDFNNKITMAKQENEKWTDAGFFSTKKPRYSPAASCIGYSNYLFEGCKGFIGNGGKIYLHRPDEHYGRMQVSAAKIAMPKIPYNLFKKSMKMVVKKFTDTIPNDVHGFLYLQPRLLESTDSFNPYSNENYDFVVLSAPAISNPESCLTVYVETDSCKVTKGGTGFAKIASNYVQTRGPENKARLLGYDTVLWLDLNAKFIEEFSTLTFAVLIDGVLCSPRPNGNIIDSITRRTLLAIAEDNKIPTSDSQIAITNLVQSIEKRQDVVIVGCSTAKNIIAVKKFRYGNQVFEFPNANEHPLFNKLRDKLWAVNRGEYLPKLTVDFKLW